MKEKNVAILLSFLIATVAILPHIWAYNKTPPGYFFVGANMIANLPDVKGVYLPAVSNFAKGDILYKNPYDDSSPFFHYPVYLILGKIVALTTLPVIFVYHGAAFIVTFVFLNFIYKFIQLFFRDFRKKLLAFGLVSFAGLLPFTPEGIGIFSYQEPHFIVAQTTLFISLYLLLLIVKHQKILLSWLFYLSLSVLVLSMVHPWMVVLLGAFWLIWYVLYFFRKTFKAEMLAALLILILVSLPFLIYFSLKIHWTSFPLKSEVFLLLALYGCLFPLAIVGAINVFKNKQKSLPFLFLTVWFMVQLVFVYLPFPFQKKFVEGMYLPISVLGVVGSNSLFNFLRIKRSINLIGLIYRRIEEKDAFSFLGEGAKPKQKVLALPDTGMVIANWANL